MLHLNCVNDKILALEKMTRFYFRRLFCKNDGSAIIEFALVAPVFFLLLFGVVEFGLYTYHKIMVERIAVDVSRVASIGKSTDSVCSGLPTREDYIRCFVKKRAAGMINGDKIEVHVQALTAGGASTPDICFDVNPPSSEPTTCAMYEDVDGSGAYNGIAASNAGKSGQVIEVRIAYPWSVQIPFMNKFFKTVDNKGNERHAIMISAATVIKNEPFSNADMSVPF